MKPMFGISLKVDGGNRRLPFWVCTQHLVCLGNHSLDELWKKTKTNSNGALVSNCIFSLTHGKDDQRRSLTTDFFGTLRFPLAWSETAK